MKVQGDVSLYDGNLLYWASRMGRHPELSPGRAYLLKRQKGRCAMCGLLFTNMQEVVENDHRVPRSQMGSDALPNRQLLHGHCHDQKTATDGRRRQWPVLQPGREARDRFPRFEGAETGRIGSGN